MAKRAPNPIVQYVDKSQAKIVREKRTTIVERVLDEMVKQHGEASPALLVEEARNPEHPLHNDFEWDDSEAGRRYRLNQATQMILATRFVCMLVDKRHSDKLKVIEESKKATVRKFLPGYGDKPGYKPRVEVLSEEETRKMFIDRKLSVLRSWCNSVVDVEELADIRERVLTLLP